MASKLGYDFMAPDEKGFDFHDRSTFSSKAKPDTGTTIDSKTWKMIYQYIMSLAPDSISLDTSRVRRNVPLTRFSPLAISLQEDQQPSLITTVQFDMDNNRFQIGNTNISLVYSADSSIELQRDELNFHSSLTSVANKGSKTLVTESGYLFPNHIPLGTLYQIGESTVDTIARNLFRPVFTKSLDLNGDSSDEILICEFGNRTGQLSLLAQQGGEYHKTRLLAVPGTTKVEIADMNADGLEDIVVLASQGNEGIYILYNEGGLKFRADQVIQLPPEYGSSWFQLVDYNIDGHLDIVLTNGDNGDFSVFAKPYHGVRLFVNNGSNVFDQQWFYPIYGATRVLVSDYDLDGDLDFAVMSFFPDYTAAPEEGFVYLENNDPSRFDFTSYTFPQSLTGRWMVMDHGDFDLDGDVDIMLGSYTLPINKKYNPIMEGWKASGTNLRLLKNNTIK